MSGLSLDGVAVLKYVFDELGSKVCLWNSPSIAVEYRIDSDFKGIQVYEKEGFLYYSCDGSVTLCDTVEDALNVGFWWDDSFTIDIDSLYIEFLQSGVSNLV